jgi:hypothetical protein
VSAIVDVAADGFEPAVPEDGPVCPNCGGVHVLAIVEEVVDGELGAPEARPAPVQETTR